MRSRRFLLLLVLVALVTWLAWPDAPDAAILLGRAPTQRAAPTETAADDRLGPPPTGSGPSPRLPMPAALPPATFRGRVVDEAGAGVPDVKMSLRATPSRRRRPTQGAGGLRPLRTVGECEYLVTDERGRFDLDARDAAGYILTVRFVSVPAGYGRPSPQRFLFEDAPYTFVLPPALSISGRVLPDPELGVPASTAVGAYWTEDDVHRFASAVADEGGAFVLHGLPEGARVDLFTTPGYPGEDAVLSVGGTEVMRVAGQVAWRTDRVGVAHGILAGSRGVDIQLGGGPSLRILALDESGQPLARTHLQLTPERATACPPRTVLTDERGEVEVTGLLQGRYRVETLPRGGKPLALRAAQTAQVPGPAVRLTFPRLAKSLLRGRLVGSGSVAGFRILVLGPDPTDHETVLADAEGRFEILTFEPRLGLRAERFGDDRYGQVSGVVPGGDEVLIELRTGGSIEGRILDVDGGPLGSEGTATASNDDVFSRAAFPGGGRFAFTGLPPGRYTVRVQVPGAPRPIEVAGVEPDGEALVLHVPNGR